MKKMIEVWSKCSPIEKALSIVAAVLFAMYLLIAFLFAFGILEGAESILKLIMGILWGYLGFAYWKKNRKIAILYFGLSFANLVLAVLFLLN